MKQFVQKKLSYAQVVAVTSEYKGDFRCMQRLAEPYFVAGVPEGYYALNEKGILLPRRRKGEKFSVTYTEMKQVTL